MIFDIRDYGAVASPDVMNTKAIQSAIDACCAAGGGKVVISGGTYMTGTLRMRSNVNLSIEASGVLLASPLQVNLPVGVELQIGQYTVAAFGVVKNVVKNGECFKVGVQFVHLDSPEAELLRLLEMMDGRH